ncbi:P-type DNA transfer ATPase VirB11 [Dickeya dadantii]|nr:P-type DNA transfer ATPase VirB11 [Dickeya dadantii]NPE68980.1 P-type DNA transfer ATPase VirB11 [Dickeya dadantii]
MASKNGGNMVRNMLAPLAPFVQNAEYTEIIINTPGKVFVKGADNWKEFDCPDMDETTLQGLTRAVATYNDTKEKALSYFTMPDGERCTIVAPPACINGYYGFVIRKFLPISKTLNDYVNDGAFSDCLNASYNIISDSEIRDFSMRKDHARISNVDADMLYALNERDFLKFFKLAIDARKNIVISGATGSGKTTFMRALIELIDKDERLITLEDVNELKLDSFPNKFHLIFGRGEGQISSSELLEACMRLTPDRILLAELRGVEAWDFLKSLNTGHPGAITSTHTGSTYRAFTRIATLANQNDEAKSLGFDNLLSEVFTTIDIVVQLHKRKITEIFFDPIYVSQRKSKLNN